MDYLCSSEFWNWDLTWNTTTPIFTPCFLKVGLIWGPAAFFWLFAPLSMYFVLKNKERKIPWSPLNILKLSCAFALLVLSAVDMSFSILRFTEMEVQPVEYYTPFVLFLTMVAVILVMFLMRRKGIITSGVLFLFWFFMFLGTGANYYVAMQKTFNQAFSYDREYDDYQFTTIVFYFGLSAIEFFLHCFADRRVSPSSNPKRENPEERASFLSELTFWWFNAMAYLGYKKPLASSDMYELNEDNRTETLERKFNKYWLPLVEFIKNRTHKLNVMMSRRTSSKDAITISPSNSDGDLSKLSILKPIVKMFAWEFSVAALLKLGGSVITFVNPILLE